jgi:hypothetical protein
MKTRVVAFALTALTVAAACSAVGSNAVDRSADERAHRAGLVMERVRDGTAVDMVRRVIGGDPSSGTAIEVLVAEGDRFQGRIVLRITEKIDTGEFSAATGKTVRCYEYKLHNSIDDYDPHQIGCPDTAALAIAPPTTTSTLPSDLEGNLRRQLEMLDRAHLTEAAIRAAVTEVANGAAIVDVSRVDDTFGIAVGNGIDECVAASITADALEVWRLPRVLAQPGELGCSADLAARGAGKHSPH